MLRNLLLSLTLLVVTIFGAVSPAAALCGTGTGTCYWIPGSGSANWSATTNWSIASGGVSCACTPTTGDAIVFDGNSGTTTSTINASISISTLVATGYTGTLAHSGSVTLTATGNVTFASGMTYAAANRTEVLNMAPASGTTTLQTNGIHLASLTINGASGTEVVLADSTGTVNVTQAIGSIITVTQGTLDAATNNVNVNVGNYNSGTGTATRAMNMGSGTWTVTGDDTFATTFAMGTSASNMTLSAGTSTLAFTNSDSTNKSFVTGGQTYSTVNYNPGSNAGFLNLGLSATFGTFGITAPANVALNTGATYTVTNPVAWVGTSSSPIQLRSNSSLPSGIFSFASGSTIFWGTFYNVNCGSTSNFTANNSLNLGGNTNCTINTPSAGGGGHIIGG